MTIPTDHEIDATLAALDHEPTFRLAMLSTIEKPFRDWTRRTPPDVRFLLEDLFLERLAKRFVDICLLPDHHPRIRDGLQRYALARCSALRMTQREVDAAMKGSE